MRGHNGDFFGDRAESKVIKEAKFQAIGCAGAFASGSAITEMIKGKTVEQAEKIEEEDVIDWLVVFQNRRFIAFV